MYTFTNEITTNQAWLDPKMRPNNIRRPGVILGHRIILATASGGSTQHKSVRLPSGANLRRLAFHGLLDKLSDPLFESLLVHRAFLVKESIVFFGPLGFSLGEKGLAAACRTNIVQGELI